MSPLEDVYQRLIRRGFDRDAVHDAMVGILTKGIDTIEHLDHYARQAAFFAFLRAKRRQRQALVMDKDRRDVLLAAHRTAAPEQIILAELCEIPLDLVTLAAQGMRTKGQQSRLRRWRQKTLSHGGGTK